MSAVLDGAKILVTGAAGFIGSHLCDKLFEQGAIIIGLDNLQTGRLENIQQLLQKDTFKFLQGDIRDLDYINRLIQKEQVAFIFHLAALPSIPRSIDAPFSTHQANVDGTLNLLLAAKNNGTKRVIFASSSSVYGTSERIPKVEAMLTQPISPYAVSKLTGEMYCKAFSSSFGLETVSLRYFNVFGPRQSQNQYAGVIPIFINSILRNHPLQIFGDGEQSRDFTFVQNVVEATILAAQASNVTGEVFNIAFGKRTTINTLARTLAEICGIKNQEVSHFPPRTGDVRHSQADVSKARNLLNYNPITDLRQGLEHTVAWYRQSLEDNM
ncbi:MAG: SDR family oxidoreductase [Candidatus Heimdallarchaeota archaeon]